MSTLTFLPFYTSSSVRATGGGNGLGFALVVKMDERGEECKENQDDRDYALYTQGHYEMAAPAFKRAIEIGDAHNYIQWSNLSGIYALIPSRKAESKAAMERALQLLKTRLEKHPEDSMLISRYAMFNASLGRFDLARETLARVPFDTDLPALEVYYAAITYGFLGEPETAITMLERALDTGYPLKEILKDPELAKLREHPNFQLMLVARESEKEKDKE